MVWSVDWWTVLGWAGFVVGLVVAVWALLWDRARGRKRCPKCWYDLAGAKVGEVNALRCPECGRVVKRERELSRTRRRWRWGVPALVVMVIGLIAGSVHDPAGVRSRGWVALAPTPLLVMVAPVGESAWRIHRSDGTGRVYARTAWDAMLRECEHRLLRGEMGEAWSQVLIDRWLGEPGVRGELFAQRDVWPRDAFAGVAWEPPVGFGGSWMVVRMRLPGIVSRWQYTTVKPEDVMLAEARGFGNRMYEVRRLVEMVRNRPGEYRVEVEWWLPEIKEDGGELYAGDAFGGRRVWRGSVVVRVEDVDAVEMMRGISSPAVESRVHRSNLHVDWSREWGYRLRGGGALEFIEGWALDGPLGVRFGVEQDGAEKLWGVGVLPGDGFNDVSASGEAFERLLFVSDDVRQGRVEGLDVARAYTIVVRGDAAESCSHVGNMLYWDGEVRIEVDPMEE